VVSLTSCVAMESHGAWSGHGRLAMWAPGNLLQLIAWFVALLYSVVAAARCRRRPLPATLPAWLIAGRCLLATRLGAVLCTVSPASPACPPAAAAAVDSSESPASAFLASSAAAAVSPALRSSRVPSRCRVLKR